MKVSVTFFLMLCFAMFCEVNAQSNLFVKFSETESISCFINDKPITLNNSKELLLKSDTAIHLEIRIEKDHQILSQKQFNFEGSRSYSFEKNGHQQYKFRLRSHLIPEAPIVELHQNDIKRAPSKIVVIAKDTVQKEYAFNDLIQTLEEAHFVFDKIRLANHYIEETGKISSNELAQICTYLNHEYAQWQVVKKGLPTLTDPENIDVVQSIFSNKQYQEKVSTYNIDE